MLGRHGRAMQVRELLGVQFHRQAKAARVAKDRRHLVARKGDALAKAIHRVDQILGMTGVHARQNHVADIARAVVLVFRRQGMGGQPGGLDMHRTLFTDQPRHAQHLDFIRDGQPIARLDFQRGDALGDQRIDPGQGRGQQRRLAPGAGGIDRRQDAAASPGDVFVAGAFQTHLELAGAVAAKDDMGMAVDQPRRHQPPPQILPRDTGIVRRQIRFRADPADSRILDDDGAPVDQPVTA